MEPAKRKILVVDNHPLILKYISDLLEKKGYRVETAEDGLLALDLLKVFLPDCILVDLIMPNIDGATLCKIIRNDPRFQKTPIFILSAVAVEETCHLEALGADLCIAKGPLPEMGNHILQAISGVGTRKSAGSEKAVIGLENLHPRQITKELLVANKHLEAILEHISDGIIEISRDGRILFANSAAAECFASSKVDLPGSDFLSWFHEENRLVAARFLEKTGGEILQDVLRQGDRYLSIKVVPMGTDGGVSVILLNDVTDYEQTRQALEESNNELKMLARSDPLTKIANRRWFDERLREEWRRMQRERSELSLLLCDIDNLKEFNDRHGHMVGDECLKAVARSIAAQTKRPADFAARYGGDEFAIILPNTFNKGAEYIAGQLRGKLLDLRLYGGTQALSASVSMSIGICSARPSSGKHTVETLLSVADDAMYEAKRQGKDQVVSRRLDDERDDSFNFQDS